MLWWLSPCRVVPEERLKEIEAQIAAFAVDESRTEPLAFPASLPSHERKVVHRLAEEYNLSHESFGLGKERHIQVLSLSLSLRVCECGVWRACVRACFMLVLQLLKSECVCVCCAFAR
jgi:hypothetical protein